MIQLKGIVIGFDTGVLMNSFCDSWSRFHNYASNIEWVAAWGAGGPYHKELFIARALPAPYAIHLPNNTEESASIHIAIGSFASLVSDQRKEAEQWLEKTLVPWCFFEDQPYSPSVVKRRTEYWQSLGYTVASWLEHAEQVGVPQRRARRFWLMTRLPLSAPFVAKVPESQVTDGVISAPQINSILDIMTPHETPKWGKVLLSLYPIQQLAGIICSDRRFGKNILSSWDCAWYGPVSLKQKIILNAMQRVARRVQYSRRLNAAGNCLGPLKLSEIKNLTKHFIPQWGEEENKDLEYLVRHNYLTVRKWTEKSENVEPKVVHGFLLRKSSRSFPVTQILDGERIAPVLHSIDYGQLAVITPFGLRTLYIHEVVKIMGLENDTIISTLVQRWIDKKCSYRRLFEGLVRSSIPAVVKPACDFSVKTIINNIIIAELNGINNGI